MPSKNITDIPAEKELNWFKKTSRIDKERSLLYEGIRFLFVLFSGIIITYISFVSIRAIGINSRIIYLIIIILFSIYGHKILYRKTIFGKKFHNSYAKTETDISIQKTTDEVDLFEEIGDQKKIVKKLESKLKRLELKRIENENYKKDEEISYSIANLKLQIELEQDILKDIISDFK